MESVWTAEKRAIAALRNWVIGLSGALVVGAILFFHYSGSLHETEDRGPSDGATSHKPEKAIAAKIADDPVALFTLVLCVFTGGLFWATFLLWGATKRLVDDAGQNAERQLRAYVFPDIVAITGFASEHPVIQISFKNTGQTPAYGVLFFSGAGVQQNAAIEEDSLPEDLNSESGFLPAGALNHSYVTPEKIVSGDREAINEGKAALYFFGGFYYTDIFKKRRKTRFCYYRSTEGQGSNVYVDGPMSVYEKWNYAD